MSYSILHFPRNPPVPAYHTLIAYSYNNALAKDVVSELSRNVSSFPYHASNLPGSQYANLCSNSQVRCPLTGRECIWFAPFKFDFSNFADGSDNQVTSEVIQNCQEGLKNVDIGIFTLHCLHTSAGLTVSPCFFGSFVTAMPVGSLAEGVYM